MQETRTAIKSRMGSKFGRIRPGTYELAVFERLENHIDLLLEICCNHSSAFIFGWIFFIHTGNKTIHKSFKLEFREDSITDFGEHYFSRLWTVSENAHERLKNQ